MKHKNQNIIEIFEYFIEFENDENFLLIIVMENSGEDLVDYFEKNQNIINDEEVNFPKLNS
jgi:hypothetical protein